MAVGLLMAGGAAERMRASGIPTPKPLVRVCGATLLEWSLFMLLRAAVEEVVVATPAHSPEVARFARGQPASVAAAANVKVSVVEESEPLGNIGAARLLADRDTEVVVVYADNLTTLDLTALVAHHVGASAAFTLAAHEEPFRHPYGELTISDGRVLSYDEKPARLILICSGITVLAPRALGAIPAGRSTGSSTSSTRFGVRARGSPRSATPRHGSM